MYVCVQIGVFVCVLPSVTTEDEILSEMYCSSWIVGHTLPVVQGRKLRQRLTMEPLVATASCYQATQPHH